MLQGAGTRALVWESKDAIPCLCVLSLMSAVVCRKSMCFGAGRSIYVYTFLPILGVAYASD